MINWDYQRHNVAVADGDEIEAEVGYCVPVGEVDALIILDQEAEDQWGHEDEAERCENTDNFSKTHL